MDELLRVLEMVRRELGAADARAEVGGQPPVDPSCVWVKVASDWRVVVLFDPPPTDAAARREKLEALLAPFEDVVARVSVPFVGLGPIKQRELDEQLDALAERAGARAALVIDERSPVLWGCSAARAPGWDLDAMERARTLSEEARRAGLDPIRWLADGMPEAAEMKRAGVDETVAQRWSHRFHRLTDIAPLWGRTEWQEALQIATAVGACRAACAGGHAPDRLSEHSEDWGVFARGFAQIYLLALVYDGGFSELHAEGPTVRALPHIEALVLALPPVDPPPKAAKVIALRRPS